MPRIDRQVGVQHAQGDPVSGPAQIAEVLSVHRRAHVRCASRGGAIASVEQMAAEAQAAVVRDGTGGGRR